MLIEFCKQLISNLTFLTALAAMIIAQALKILYYWMVERDLNWRHFFEVGGMPSSHSALVVSLSFILGFIHGFNSSYFSIAAVISSIVMHDAIKVRPEEVAHNLMQVSTGALLGFFVSVASFLMFVR